MQLFCFVEIVRGWGVLGWSRMSIDSAKIPPWESIPPCSLYASSFNQKREEGSWVQDFLLLPQGFESFPSDLP